MEVNLHWQLDFTFRDDKNTSMAKTGAKNLQIMKKIVLSILRLAKESYKNAVNAGHREHKAGFRIKR